VKPICLLEEFPDVWAENRAPGLVHYHGPVMVELKPGALPFRQRQYLVPRKAHLGIQTHLQWLKVAGILIDCQSPWSIPLLLVKKVGEKNTGPSRTSGQSTMPLSHCTQ
jgi:hypothetical protein